MAHSFIPTINLIIIDDSNILLSRRRNTGWSDNMLCIPGGHIEKNETPIKAAIREAREELGVNLSAKDLEFLCVAIRKSSSAEIVAFEFLITEKLDFYNAEPEKCSELLWVDINNLPNDVIPDFTAIIKEAIIGKAKYLELGY